MEEGLSRDLVRAVQTRRKEIDLAVSDHIKLTVFSSDVANKAFENFKAYISNETLADEIIIQENDGIEAEVGDEKAKILVEKV